MVVQRESSVPRTSKVQSDNVALYKSLLERSKVVQDGILLGNLGIVTVDVDIELPNYKVTMLLLYNSHLELLKVVSYWNPLRKPLHRNRRC